MSLSSRLQVPLWFFFYIFFYMTPQITVSETTDTKSTWGLPNEPSSDHQKSQILIIVAISGRQKYQHS